MDADYALIKRMRRGDEAAFDQFIHKYYADILRYCAYHCFDAEDAKDLTQETFLRFYSGFSSYAHRGKAKNYLYTIARNLCNSHCSRARGHPLACIDASERREKMGLDASLQITVRMCIDQLPWEYREVIILYYYQDLRQSEIAKVLNIGLPLVKYRLKKAKERLEIMLRTEG